MSIRNSRGTGETFVVDGCGEAVYSTSDKGIQKKEITIIFSFISEFNIAVDRVHNVNNIINIMKRINIASPEREEQFIEKRAFKIVHISEQKKYLHADDFLHK